MIETYPFFREEDERTQAVIGEDAIISDLNGTYLKPYAVLTQKRLYYKNEFGNFIVNNSEILQSKSVHAKKLTKYVMLLILSCFLLGCFLLITQTCEYINYFHSVYFRDEAMELLDRTGIRDEQRLFSPLFYIVRISTVASIVVIGITSVLKKKRATVITCMFSFAISILCCVISFLDRLFVFTPNIIFGRYCPISILGAIFNLIGLSICIAYLIKTQREAKTHSGFIISCKSGTFSFNESLYGNAEIGDFEIQLRKIIHDYSKT